jgi:hypothetical protein
MVKKIIRYSLITIAILLSLSFLITVLVKVPRVQTYIVQKVAGFLSNKLHTTVNVGSVNITFFRTADIKNIYIEDQRHDTLLSLGNLETKIGLFSLFGKQTHLDLIELDDATIKLFRARNDSDFNLQFIINAFASKNTTTKGGSAYKFSVSNFELNNIKFVMRDESSANEIKINLRHGIFNFRKVDLSVPLLDFNNASIDKTDLTYTDFSYLYPPETNLPSDTGIVHLNTKAFQLLCKKFKMTDCSFTMNMDTLKPAKGEFDPAHIAVSSINMDIENGTFIKDTIQGQFKDFSAAERSGFVVKHISANTKITPKQITLKRLNIQTNNSEVKNYFQMNFHDFRAFTEFTTSVTMKGNLDNCKISFFDIAYFAPAVKDVIDKTLLVDGEVSGPVNNLLGKNFKLRFGKSGSFDGDIELNGLPDLDETYADIDVRQLTATSYDLKELLPSLKLPGNVSTLGQINFTGTYTGFFSDFVTYGTFNTYIGSVSTDINFKLDKHNHASYSGNFSADSFNVGKFFDEDSLLGTITFGGNIMGNGLRADNVSAQMDGYIEQFVFNHYNYHELTVFGKFDRKEFNGKLDINDKNLGLDFSGTVDFNDTIPKFNFTADVSDAHLQNLHFANKDYVLNSTMDLNLRGNDWDNAIGNVNIEHTKFELGGKKYEIDSINLNSSLIAAEKTVTLKSDVLDANLTGNFQLDNFYDSFIAMMKHYFPSWPVTAKENTVAQNLHFNFAAKNVVPFTNFFFPNITGLTGSTASGSISTTDKTITMTGLIPELDYKNFKFQTLNLSIDVTKHDRLKMSINAKNFSLSDSMGAQNVDVSFAVRNDSALCYLKTADSSFANRVNFSAWLIGSPDSLKFSFFKSKFYINNVAWTIPDSNSITYSQDHILINNLFLKGPNAQITFSGVKTNIANTLTASFANIHIEDFYNLLKIHDYSIYGLLNGDLTVINPLFHRPHLTSDITVNDLRFNTDTLGQLIADIALDTLQQNVNFNFSIKQDGSNANVTGLYNLYGDSGLTATINLKDIKLALASPFLTGLASDIKGECNGTLKLQGTIRKPQIKGKVVIPSGEATIDYLKTHYKFSNETVDFTDNLISLHDVTLYDSYNNEATLKGEIIHNHLTEFRLNLYMNTKNFLVLNTTLRDNDLFYGKAFGSGTVYFSGPLNDLEIDAEIKSEKNTVISIPISGGQSIADRTFIRFISKGKQAINPDSALPVNSNLKLNFDLDVTPDAQINIILDQTTGEIIKGNGNGNLRMEINTAGTFNMYGTYTIEKGSYLFTYKNFINKHFTIDNGGTISWSGDPYKARININAIYSLKTNLSSLISTNQTSDQTVSQTVPVDVVMNLTGSLLTPNINFDITVPDQSSSFSDLALSRLQQIREDKSELNKQVFALLIMNSFIPEQSSTSQLVSSSAITSFSEFFTSQFSNILSNNKTNINVNYYSYTGALSATNPSDALTGKEFAADVSQRLLNDRLTVTVGGNVDVNSTTTQNSSTNVAGDFDIDYTLTPDGRYTLKAFRKNQYDDIAQQNIGITGVGISFKKEFNKFKEIFHRANKKNKMHPK